MIDKPTVIFYFRDVLQEHDIDDKSRPSANDRHPEWLHLTILKFRQFNPGIRPKLLTTAKQTTLSESADIIDLHEPKYYTYFKTFLDKYRHCSNNPLSLDMFSLTRWFEIANYIKVNNIKPPIIYVESDILVYDDVREWVNLPGEKAFTTGTYGSGGVVIIKNLDEFYKLGDMIYNTWVSSEPSHTSRLDEIIKIHNQFVENNQPGGISDPWFIRRFLKENPETVCENIDKKIVDDAVIDWGISDTYKACKETNFHWDTCSEIDKTCGRWIKKITWLDNQPYCYSHRFKKNLRQRTLGFHSNMKLMIPEWFNLPKKAINEEEDIQRRIITLIETNKISTTEVADALGKSGHIPGVLPINKNHHVVGKARLIYNYDGTNWPLHDAIQNVCEGEVVYVYCDNCENLAIFGDLVSKYLMLYKRCKAIVCDGLVRDVHRIIKENYPVWSSGRSPIGCNNNKPEKLKYLSNEKIKKYKDGVIVCDDTGAVLIEKHQLTQELYNKLKIIELQEDVWYYCLDTKKQSTFEIVCEKKYLLPDHNLLINDNIDKLKNML